MPHSQVNVVGVAQISIVYFYYSIFFFTFIILCIGYLLFSIVYFYYSFLVFSFLIIFYCIHLWFFAIVYFYFMILFCLLLWFLLFTFTIHFLLCTFHSYLLLFTFIILFHCLLVLFFYYYSFLLSTLFILFYCLLLILFSHCNFVVIYLNVLLIILLGVSFCYLTGFPVYSLSMDSTDTNRHHASRALVSNGSYLFDCIFHLTTPSTDPSLHGQDVFTTQVQCLFPFTSLGIYMALWNEGGLPSHPPVPPLPYTHKNLHCITVVFITVCTPPSPAPPLLVCIIPFLQTWFVGKISNVLYPQLATDWGTKPRIQNFSQLLKMPVHKKKF